MYQLLAENPNSTDRFPDRRLIDNRVEPQPARCFQNLLPGHANEYAVFNEAVIKRRQTVPVNRPRVLLSLQQTRNNGTLVAPDRFRLGLKAEINEIRLGERVAVSAPPGALPALLCQLLQLGTDTRSLDLVEIEEHGQLAGAQSDPTEFDPTDPGRGPVDLRTRLSAGDVERFSQFAQAQTEAAAPHSRAAAVGDHARPGGWARRVHSFTQVNTLPMHLPPARAYAT